MHSHDLERKNFNLILNRNEPHYTQQQWERIRLGRELANEFYDTRVPCRSCNQKFSRSYMTHMKVGLLWPEEELPEDCYLRLREVREHYRSIRFDAVYSGRSLFGRTICGKEWLAKHSSRAIRKKAEAFRYATLWCPVEQYLVGVHPPCIREDMTAKEQRDCKKDERAYAKYLKSCEKYVLRHLPGSRDSDFYCYECAVHRRDMVQELVRAWQDENPAAEQLPDSCRVRRSAVRFSEPPRQKDDPMLSPIEQAGWEGEQMTNYELEWLPKTFVSMRKFPQHLLLSNPQFRRGERQEYDHLLVSPWGVFSIETKNMSGAVTIRPDGQWTRVRQGRMEGIPAPTSQAERHELLLESFLPRSVPVHSIICLANRNVTIEGAQNARCTVLRWDTLRAYLEDYAASHRRKLTPAQVQDTIRAIREHTVKI